MEAQPGKVSHLMKQVVRTLSLVELQSSAQFKTQGMQSQLHLHLIKSL